MLLRIFHRVPCLRAFLPYVLGILLLPHQARLCVSLVLLGLGGMGYYRWVAVQGTTAWSLRWLPGAAFALWWAALGGFSMARTQSETAFVPVSDPLVARVCVQEPLQMKARSLSTVVKVQRVSPTHTAWLGRRLQLYFSKDWQAAELHAGDELLLRVRPSAPLPSARPGDFDGAKWLNGKGVGATAYVSPWAGRVVRRASRWNALAWSERTQRRFKLGLERAGLKGQPLALILALVLGDRADLTPETKNAFSVTGIAHILSVSGLHVGVVYGLLLWAVGFLERNRYARLPTRLLLVVALFAYAFLTGCSPSVVRSAFMFSLMATGICLRRRSNAINTVLFSAFVLLLFRPTYLFDLSFQLSYLAVLSIVSLHSRVVGLWQPRNKWVQRVWEMLCLSLVAQLGTAPLTVWVFHTFPNYFLLNNLLAVPFSAALIYLTLPLLFLGWIQPLGEGLGWLLQHSAGLFLQGTQWVGQLPYAVSRHLFLSGPEVALLYLFALCLALCFLWKKRRWIWGCVGCFLCVYLVHFGALFWW
jgi:competence protein ComEC